MSTFSAKASVLAILASVGCGGETAGTKADLRSTDGADATADELSLTAEVHESVAALLGGTVSFVKDFEISVIQCDPSNPKTPHVLVKTATKAQLAAGEVRLSKQMKNLRVVLSKIKAESTGIAADLVMDIAKDASLCTAYQAFKANGIQTYGTVPPSGISAVVQSEKNLLPTYDAATNQAAIAFDVAVRSQVSISQVDVTIAEAARSVESTVEGTSPTAFSVDKASIVNKSALTDNTCTFQLTLKCTSAPVVASGKLVSCAGIELAKNPWRLDERSGTTPVVQAQPTGSSNPLSLATLVGSDSINLPFTFACNRGKAGVATEKKTLALSIWNKLGCDNDSVAANLQCGQQTFVFPIALTYTLP
jgi:hypothetical protein